MKAKQEAVGSQDSYSQVMNAERLLTTGELAKALGISQRSVARYAQTGQLEPALVTPGGQYRWDLDDVHRQLKAMRKR